MGADDVRKQFLTLQKEFMGGNPASKLKKHELEHKMDVLRKAMAMKVDTPEPAPARSGPPAAREVKTKKVVINEETEINKPVAPKEGKAHVSHYKKKAKEEPTVEIVVEEKPAAPKKARKVPPKVVLPDEPVAPKPKAEPKPKKSKATAAPKTEAPIGESEPSEPVAAPVVVAPVAIKLPGGVRKLPESEVQFN